MESSKANFLNQIIWTADIVVVVKKKFLLSRNFVILRVLWMYD